MAKATAKDNYGFSEVSTEPDAPPPLAISAYAPEGCGKTRFGLTAPGVVYVFSIDPNTRAVVKMYKQEHPEKQIHLIEFNAPVVSFSSRDDVETVAVPEWNRVLDTYRAVLEDQVRPHADSVVWDTATELRELQLLAQFGKTIQIPQHLYTPVNAIYQDALKAGRRSGKHLILLHRAKDLYETKKIKTAKGWEDKDVKVPGEYVRQGYNRTGNMIELEVQLKHDPTRSDDDLSERFGLKIMKNTNKPMTTGEEYWGQIGGKRKVHVCTVPFCGTLLYPDTTTSDWT